MYVGLLKSRSMPGCGLAEKGASGKSQSQSGGSLARKDALKESSGQLRDISWERSEMCARHEPD